MLGELINIQPAELKFPFELKKQIQCSLRLVNVTSEYVAFKVKTTSPKKYCVRPNTGVVPPQSSAEVTVTMQAQREAPPDMVCKDKFLVQSVTVPQGSSTKDLSQDLFMKESGRDIREAKLRVLYVAPPQPPSPVAESAEEGVASPSPFANSNDKGRFDLDVNTNDPGELRAKLLDAKQAVAHITDERNHAAREKQQLQQEMAKLKSSMDSQIAQAVASSKGVAGGRSRGGQAVATKTGGGVGKLALYMLICFFFAFMLGYFYGQAPTPPPAVAA